MFFIFQKNLTKNVIKNKETRIFAALIKKIYKKCLLL